MEDIIASLINARGSDRAKVHELLHEYLTLNRDESEASAIGLTMNAKLM